MNLPRTRTLFAALLPTILACAALLLLGQDGGAGSGNATPKPYQSIAITGDSASLGFFDPSLEHDDGDVLWMTYTAVELEEKGNAHSLGLARSKDGGETWQFVTRIAESPHGEVTLKGTKIPGNWRNEVSTLVYDKDDPDSGRRWKLFWHKYFMRPPFGEGDRLAAPFGWIAYKCAASPPALAQAEETRLFGNYPAPLDPFDGRSQYPVKHYLNRIHRNLDGFLAFTEPGSLARGKTLYLSLEGIPPVFDRRQIFLLASGDHGNTWQYRGVLLDRNDARNLDTPILTASSLFEQHGRAFLLATPVTPKGHKGVLVFEFESLHEAKLRNDSSGNSLVIKRVEPFLAGVGGAGGGAGDFDSKKTYGGIVMCAVDAPNAIKKRSKEGAFKIYDTMERVVAEP